VVGWQRRHERTFGGDAAPRKGGRMDDRLAAIEQRVARLEADNAQLRALLRLVGSMFDSDLLLAKPLGSPSRERLTQAS
jgi:hypothetical protein